MKMKYASTGVTGDSSSNQGEVCRMNRMIRGRWTLAIRFLHIFTFPTPFNIPQPSLNRCHAMGSSPKTQPSETNWCYPVISMFRAYSVIIPSRLDSTVL